MRRSIDSASVLSNDDMSEYDIISDGQQSLESSIADLGLVDKMVRTKMRSLQERWYLSIRRLKCLGEGRRGQWEC